MAFTKTTKLGRIIMVDGADLQHCSVEMFVANEGFHHQTLTVIPTRNPTPYSEELQYLTVQLPTTLQTMTLDSTQVDSSQIG